MEEVSASHWHSSAAQTAPRADKKRRGAGGGVEVTGGPGLARGFCFVMNPGPPMNAITGLKDY